MHATSSKRWIGEWRERDERVAEEAHWYLSLVELHAGRWDLAQRYAESAREIGEQYGQATPQQMYPLGLIALHRGELDRAGEFARCGIERAEQETARLGGLAAIPGVAAAWSGDPETAVTSFAAAEQNADASDWGEPHLRYWRGDYVEALLELGRIDEALAVLNDWERAAERVGRGWVIAHATRCRGLVAAARNEIDDAVRTLEEAVLKHEAAGDPFGRARALLALGVVRRRARQKRPAREAIEEALAGFETLGAVGWAERSRVELGRVGGRTRVEGLTPAERRVATLVAEGKTNREVASALFLGERTVASHLTHIYAKLGVRSRTELARKIQTF